MFYPDSDSMFCTPDVFKRSSVCPYEYTENRHLCYENQVVSNPSFKESGLCNIEKDSGIDMKPLLDTTDHDDGSSSFLDSCNEEINTRDLAETISNELKRYSIPQAVFAQHILCRSQGTLSDLLRNPKPWNKLKSGRETFRRMWKWLQEPEFQRISTLKLMGILLLFCT